MPKWHEAVSCKLSLSRFESDPVLHQGVSFNGSGRSSPERVIEVRILVRPPLRFAVEMRIVEREALGEKLDELEHPPAIIDRDLEFLLAEERADRRVQPVRDVLHRKHTGIQHRIPLLVALSRPMRNPVLNPGVFT